MDHSIGDETMDDTAPARTTTCMYPTLTDLSQALLQPLEDLQQADLAPETSLSRIPWRISIQGQNGGIGKEEAQGTAFSSLPSKVEECEEGTQHDQQQEEQRQNAFPSHSYLDLRRQQNVEWATCRLQEGNDLFFLDPQKAESSYKEGLDLVPEHVELLVAYGRLLEHRNQKTVAMHRFQMALKLDPSHVVARLHLDRLQGYHKKNQHKRHPADLITHPSDQRDYSMLPNENAAIPTSAALFDEKDEVSVLPTASTNNSIRRPAGAKKRRTEIPMTTANAAYHDAMVERNFFLEDSTKPPAAVSNSVDGSSFQIEDTLERQEEHQSDSSRSVRKKEKKKRKKKHHKKKRSSRSHAKDDSSDESGSSEYETKRRKDHKKRKRKR